MAVHAHRHTGQQGHIVLALHDGQILGVRGDHRLDLVHGVGQRLVIDMDAELVPDFQLGKVRKEPLQGVPSCLSTTFWRHS